MTLIELLQLLRRHLALVIALPVVCALVAGVYCWGFMADEYTAETSIYAYTQSDSNANGAYSEYQDLNAAQLLANDFAELADNAQIQQETADALGMKSLEGYDVQVESSTSTRVIKIDVTGKDASSAALIANKLAEHIGDTALQVMNVSAVNVISTAEVPDTPSGPKRLLYVIVALLAGLFIAIAVVVLRDLLDTTFHSDAECAEYLGIPVIGRLPQTKLKGGR